MNETVKLLMEKHADTWRDRPDAYWFSRLIREVAELSSGLSGGHGGDADYQLAVIASICLNWLEKREKETSLEQTVKE